ncbi:uncharacterized protein F5891DRAFT_1211537 [Suillus fuscotomentosus]|uniref:DUF221-domain-containing protein n=1 Tax=Suillus fuscotomentosus TaxID=1912939 RepID=A0AAD4HNN3_9AGAM|nr:uncharacterized protein F5891DRAFT_1211537 [Suillus fuscotomentosus]KAG1903283.1 hypothetical protein F5891DRAFT_1211537 [Suillus fuscotomentosus]
MADIGEIINENASSRTITPAAVGSQVALMTIISTLTIVIFNVLRPKNKVIYEPKVKYHVGDKQPPRISDSLLGWLPPLIRTKEPELVDKLGLDAVTFLRFTRMTRSLYSAIAFICCAILIPINVSYNLKNVPSTERDVLSILTIRDVKGSFLFAHVVVSYVISALVMVFVWRHWKEMLRLRQQWFRSPEYMQSFYARTLAVMHVPKKYQSDEGIHAIFASVQVPYPTTSVHIGRKVGRLPELIEYHNTAVRELEQVLVTYLKGGKIAKERPTIRIGGFMGMGGTKKDAIDFYTAKLRRTEQAIEDYRQQIDSRKAENYGFASMAAIPYAHIVATLLRKKHPKGTDIALAPNPKDIIWANFNKSTSELIGNKFLGSLFLVLFCFFNTIPLFIISILANLSSISAYVGFLSTWAIASPGSFAFVSGVSPPAISALFGFFLPIVMRRLSKFQGALTHSRLDRAVVARYFAFLVISQLIIFTLIGVGFIAAEQIVTEIGHHTSFQDIINNLHTLPSTINQTYINQSSYWLTYFPLRGFLVLFDLAQILNLLWTSFKTRVFGRTPRDIREWTQPPEFEYAIYYSLFMATVALVFAPLAPLVALAGAIVFWIGSWVYKYQLMFVFITKVESGGRLWNMIVNRLLISVILMQLLMALTIGLQYGFKSFMWLTTVPPILFIIIFKFQLDRTFYKNFLYYIPSETELREAKVHSSTSDVSGRGLEKRFDLFTPMLHARMMPLLGDVYKGKIGSDKAKLDEYGGQKLDAQVIEGGLKIAAIEQRDLEYDPALYRRDRGELDWDQRSIASAAIFGNARGGDNASLYHQKAHQYAGSISGGRASPAPPAFDRYLAQGPSQSLNDIELARMNQSVDQLPLLTDHQSYGYFDARQQPPPSPLHEYNSPDRMTPPSRYGSPAPMATLPQMQYPPHPGIHTEGYREAPLHRPYPPQRPNSTYSVDPSQYMSGRSAYQG